MEHQIEWAPVIQIMVKGFGAVFVIMILLAVTTTVLGKLFTRFEKPKEEQNGIS